MSQAYIDESRKRWYRADREKPDVQQLQLGCLQRIATAAEDMAQDHRRLIQERDQYEQWYREERRRRATLERSNAGLRAWNTRLRKQIEQLKAQTTGGDHHA